MINAFSVRELEDMLVPWRAACGAQPRSSNGAVRSERRSDDLPAEVHGAHGVRDDLLEAGRHYRTYAEYVEDEVVEALGDRGRFERGPSVLTSRGTADDDGPAFVVEDGRYLSGRWPGDAFLLAKRLILQLYTHRGSS